MARKKMLPIGVDIGASSAKLVQVRIENGEPVLHACASLSVPDHLKGNQAACLDFFASRLPKAIKDAKFKGKKCIIALPASGSFVRHVRVPRSDAQQTESDVRRAAQVELPYPVDEAIIRHIIAGDIYDAGAIRQEVIVVAMPHAVLRTYLQLLTNVGLEVLGVSVEPVATMGCFSHLLEGVTGAIVYIDLGSSSTQVTISLGKDIVFCRSLNGGCDQLNQVIGRGLNKSSEEIAMLRVQEQDGSDIGADGEEIHRWINLWLDGVCSDIENCLRYYEAVFRNNEFSRIIFTGGQAQDRKLCQMLAEKLHMPAQIGDPISLLEESELYSINGMLHGVPNTSYAVAVGLSLSGDKN